MQKTEQRRSESNLVQIAEIVDVAVEELKETPLPWLRREDPDEEQNEDHLALTVFELDQPSRPTVLKTASKRRATCQPDRRPTSWLCRQYRDFLRFLHPAKSSHQCVVHPGRE